LLLVLMVVPAGTCSAADPLALRDIEPGPLLVESTLELGRGADNLGLSQAQAILEDRYNRQRHPLVGALRDYLVGVEHFRRQALDEAEHPLATAHNQFMRLKTEKAACETALLLGWSRWRHQDRDAAERWLRRAVHLLPAADPNLQQGCLLLAGTLHPEVSTTRAAASVDVVSLLRPQGNPQSAGTEIGLPTGLVAGGLAGLGLIAGFLFMRYKSRQREAFKALEQQNEIIHQQKEELLAQSEKLRQHRDELHVTIQQMLDAYAELRELSKFKDALTGMIVHDLKSPLNAILLQASIRPEQPEMISIHQAARQMLNLTLNLLDVQRYENQQMPVKRSVIELHQICRDAIDQVVVAARFKQIRIELQGPTRLSVDFDPDLFMRVLVNLLSNAIKYSPAGSRIHVLAEVYPQQTLRLSIRDEGPGIPPQHREAIFDKYVQLAPGATSQAGLPSTGLGLTFCRMAVEAHGGRIWVEEPSSGPGSVFVIDLPNAILTNQPLPAPVSLVLNEIESFDWSEADRLLVLPVARALIGLEPYQYSQIQDALDQLPPHQSELIQKWAESVLDAALAGNALHYRLLASQPLRTEVAAAG
jgi:signal transduction histidine kinase